MDCLFDAYREYLEFMGVKVDWRREYKRFCRLRRFTHLGKQGYVHGSVIPFIIGQLIKPHDMQMIVDTSYFKKANWVGSAPNWLARIIARRTDYGHYDMHRVHLAPAIYMMWGGKYAVFKLAVPQHGIAVLAIQLRKEWSEEYLLKIKAALGESDEG